MKNQIERAEPSRGAPDAKHTPGPWRVGPYYRHEVVSDSGVITCAPIETEQSRTNARLIAQAPTLLAENEKLRAGHVVLLEALRSAVKILNSVDVSSQETWHNWLYKRDAVTREAEAAIQQAERT